MDKKMKIYLLHQTHTDIGYTDRQEKIERYHVDYLKQAIRISERIASGEKPAWEGFVWNNESFWILDRFLAHTDASWERRLLDAVQRGHIQLTGNYLNLNELVDEDVLKKYLQKAKTYAGEHDVTINSGISMDINGWGFGYAQALFDAGITRFYTCVHNHHGFVPFFRKHQPFYWETPEKDKILIWNGEVYNHGNVSKLVPEVLDVHHDGAFDTEAIIDDERLAYTKAWLDDYVDSLEAEGYPYDFFPMFTKGILVDNAPPNPHIVEAVNRFNTLYGDAYEFELIGINTFFDEIEAMDLDIPTYRGDWNDWWSDGYMSSPKAVMSYREAQRNYHIIRSLRSEFTFDADKLDALEYNLMLFSEHTWGYFTSVTEPWNKMTVKLDARNESFAFNANRLADELLDDYNQAHGEMMKHVGQPMLYKIKNPYDFGKTEFVKIHVNWWEEFRVEEGYEVYDVDTGRVYEHQETKIDNASRREIRVNIDLDAHASTVLGIRPKEKRQRHIPLDPLFPRDERYDYVSPYLDNTVNATQFFMESPFVRIAWKKDIGITEFFDKKTQRSLVMDEAVDPPFTPVYVFSEIEHTYKFNPEEITSVRRDYGRNRSLFSSECHRGRLINAKVIAKGPLFARVQLKYELRGTLYSVVEITVHRDEPRIDFSYIVGKDTVWEPESLYLSLPFTYHDDETLWLDKAGADIRPRIDQLPLTMNAYYTMQNGYALVSDGGSMILASPDAPLLHLGSLEPGVMTEETMKQKPNKDLQYSWLMNNYWETNFATSLGGFYRFDYRMRLSGEIRDGHRALHQAKAMSHPFIVTQVTDE